MDGYRLIPIQPRDDGRGLVCLLDGLLPFSIENMHIVDMRPGSVRGNHVHHRQREAMYISGGAFRLRLRDLDKDETQDVVHDSSAPVFVAIDPGCAHAVENIGKETIKLVCLADRPFDPTNPDTIAVPLIAIG
ncbi:MAG: WxcM-like domain-containing protein [Deltaproteobacteria bacterium]|nr:WxcM-like domain-containing protein [Deltaproteobacteria bacterium]